MFGRRDRAQARLSAKARAEVLSVDATRWAVTRGPTPVVANTERMWKLKLRVMPEGVGPFEVDINQSLPQLEEPRVGQIVLVLYDPEDHSKVAIDRSDAAQGQAAAETVASRLNPRQAATLGQITGGSIQDLMSGAISDPQGFAARMREQAEAAQRDAMAQAEAAMAQAVPTAPTTPPSAAVAEDPLDKLAKLADLRERGVVTDEEFEAQKKRILGE
jgi:Short C-terminal domain